MKVCVLGAGSLGSTIGGALAKAGNEVHFVGRAPHMNAINENIRGNKVVCSIAQ